MGHEYVGIVEEVGAEVTGIKPGQFVIGSFFASDNTCEICRAGFHTSCRHREFVGAGPVKPVVQGRTPYLRPTQVRRPSLHQGLSPPRDARSRTT